jgi:hypothetical protein
MTTPMDFHYVSILAEIKRMLGNPAYSGKIYTSFQYDAMRSKLLISTLPFSLISLMLTGHWITNRRPNKRMFRRTNSGVDFEFFSKDFPDATQVIFRLASDASFSGQHSEHYPIYSEGTHSQLDVHACTQAKITTRYGWC